MRALLLCLSLSTSACLSVPTIRLDSPQGVELSTRTFRQPVPKVSAAVPVALKTLGYEVTKSDATQVKTAPKPVRVDAVAVGGRAMAIESSVAWDIKLSQGSESTVVTAKLRGWQGGGEIPPDAEWDDALVRNLYDSLFREIESELPSPTAVSRAH